MPSSIAEGNEPRSIKGVKRQPRSSRHSVETPPPASVPSGAKSLINDRHLGSQSPSSVVQTKNDEILSPTLLDAWLSSTSTPHPYFRHGPVALYHGDAASVLGSLNGLSVDCIVTSPPYYGQRDYGADGQIGLEVHPNEYIDKLVDVFRRARLLLKPGGSLWVVIGDTYWSGKGRPRAEDAKRKYRRFDRPQDRVGRGDWCVPKQQLLIPHRFAIAMQSDGWIVRNDNVWYKPTAMPDPARDRCAVSHEYVFHFVTQQEYYFDAAAIAVPAKSKVGKKSQPSVWTIPVKPSDKKHLAVFPPDLVRTPILATCPVGGLVLDPFCGSGTSLLEAVMGEACRSAIGIDISESALEEAKELLAKVTLHQVRND